MKKRQIVIVVLVMTMVMTMVMLVIFVRRDLESSRHSTRQTLCVHNLKLLYACLKVYAEEHEGRFPSRLADLLPRYGNDPEFLEMLICPETQAICKQRTGRRHPFPENPDADALEGLCSYAYVPGYALQDAADAVLLYEKQDNHFGKGRSLMYLDGHGAWEPPENWRSGPLNETLPPAFFSAQPGE